MVLTERWSPFVELLLAKNRPFAKRLVATVSLSCDLAGRDRKGRLGRKSMRLQGCGTVLDKGPFRVVFVFAVR